MSTESVNRWLTLSANVGVMIGLILLVVELNQNSALVRAQIHQARSDSYVSTMMDLADTEYLLPAYEKLVIAGGLNDIPALDALSPTERERIRRFAQARMNGYDNLFYQYRLGYLDEEFYESKVVGSIRKMATLWRHLDC